MVQVKAVTNNQKPNVSDDDAIKDWTWTHCLQQWVQAQLVIGSLAGLLITKLA